MRYCGFGVCLILVESIRSTKMSWDDAYKQLERELGREPSTGEVQVRMLEMAESKIESRQGD